MTCEQRRWTDEWTNGVVIIRLIVWPDDKVHIDGWTDRETGLVACSLGKIGIMDILKHNCLEVAYWDRVGNITLRHNE